MSTLAEIKEAIEHLPDSQLEKLASWLEQRRPRKAVAAPVVEPDFLSRAKAIWGEAPAGKPLSALVSEARQEFSPEAFFAQQTRNLRDHLERPLHPDVLAATDIISPVVAAEEAHRDHCEKKHA